MKNNMDGKIHLHKDKKDDETGRYIHQGALLSQCGFVAGCWEVGRVEMIDYKTVDCENCKRSARYKELEELDKTMSEIKTEAEIKFNQETSQKELTDKINKMCKDGHNKRVSHYNQSSTPTIEKINEVLEHLEGKINNKQAAQIYNMLKYWDRSEHKGNMKKDLFKCADSICNAITGEFINEVK